MRTTKGFRSLTSFLLACLIVAPAVVEATEISGRVTLDGKKGGAETEVRLFDGFDMTVVKTDNDGTFAVRNDRVSPRENTVLMITRKGYRPILENFRGGETAYNQSFDLGKRKDAKKGTVAGVLFMPVSGGKIQTRFGIYRFTPDHRVTLKKGKATFDARSDEQGHFFFSVPPGEYRLKVDRISREYRVTVTAGRTTFQAVPVGRILVD